MKLQYKYFLLILAIIAAVSVPPLLCHYMLTHSSSEGPAQNTGANNRSGTPSTKTPDVSSSDTSPQNDYGSYVILIDPGHGGFDPGKVSPDGIEEKEINLQISVKLKKALEENGFSVFLTRDTDCSLDTPGSSNKKSSDLHFRTDKAAELDADLYISIHQNSYSAEYVHGAQVFYYASSGQGKKLAETIQDRLISDVDPGNTRMPKGNSDYLVLTESPCTAIIVECGFLSNTAECRSLCDPQYQSKLAEAISAAVTDWYSTQDH